MVRFIKGLMTLDKRAYEEFYRKYYVKLFNILNNMFRSKEDVEDIIQSLVIELPKKLQSYSGDYFDSWIIKVAKNHAISYYRKYKGKTIALDESKIQTDESNKTNAIIEFEDLRDYLTTEEFLLVYLYYCEGHTYQQIQKIMDISDYGCRNLKNKAMVKIEEYVRRNNQ